jgi:RNA polymerase sigma-70 factor (ECF subfamily)
LFFAGVFSALPGMPGNNSRTDGVGFSSPGSGPPSEPDPYAEHRRRDRCDIERFLGGDSGGFEELMTRYRSRAYGTALSLTGNHDDAMDAMQKAYIRVHRSLGRFRLEEPFLPWLNRIVRNTSLNQKRDEKRHQGDCPLEWVTKSDGQPDPLALALGDDLRDRLWQGLQELPEEMREVFSLYHFEGLKYREIADLLAVPIGTVMSRLHAARTSLRAVVDREETS